jgi:signal peptidase II
VLFRSEEFEFFRPVFNIADAAISIGFIVILLMQNAVSRDEELAEKDNENAAKELNQ